MNTTVLGVKVTETIPVGNEVVQETKSPEVFKNFGFIDKLLDQCPFIEKFFNHVKNNAEIFLNNPQTTAQEFADNWDKTFPNYEKETRFKFIPLKVARESYDEQGVLFFGYSNDKKTYECIVPGGNYHLSSELAQKIIYGWDFIRKIVYISKPEVRQKKENGIKFTQVGLKPTEDKTIYLEDMFLKTLQFAEFIKASDQCDIESVTPSEAERLELIQFVPVQARISKKCLPEATLEFLKEGYELESSDELDYLFSTFKLWSPSINRESPFPYTQTLYALKDNVIYITEPDKFAGIYKYVLHFIDRNYFNERVVSYADNKSLDSFQKHLFHSHYAFDGMTGKKVDLMVDIPEVIIIPEEIIDRQIILTVYQKNERMVQMMDRIFNTPFWAMKLEKEGTLKPKVEKPAGGKKKLVYVNRKASNSQVETSQILIDKEFSKTGNILKPFEITKL